MALHTDAHSLPVALTMGEPAGIGTEITLKAYRYFKDRHSSGNPGFFLIDDPLRVERACRDLNAAIPITTISDARETCDAFVHGLPVLPVLQSPSKILESAKVGHPQIETAASVISSIKQAATLAESGLAAGVVTNPIHKQTLISSGFSFKGHTEFFGDLTKNVNMPAGLARGPVMMLASPELRVSPVTVHMPIADVPQSLTVDIIVDTCIVVAQSMIRDFGIPSPLLAVCGLNPHAGEGGEIGIEDRDFLVPAIAELRKHGVQAVGPVPADTMFHEQARNKYHVAIAMYHDQALIPIKTIAFYSAVNVTLGLPMIRTSPDHGTGLDIAGKGIARPDSIIQAITMVPPMSKQRRDYDELQAAQSRS